MEKTKLIKIIIACALLLTAVILIFLSVRGGDPAPVVDEETGEVYEMPRL